MSQVVSNPASSVILPPNPTKTIPKVIIRFTAIGDAPILKQSFFKISATQRFHSVLLFLRRELGLKKDGSLFLYVNQAFAPNPDETLANLYDCFGSEGHLIINYSTTPAWG